MADQNILDKSMRSVFVGNIPYEATEEKLKDIFNEVGPVISFKLVYDRETGKPKGYGFCEYKDQETALSAMRNLNGYEISGRTLRVDNACTEKSRLEMQSLMMGMPTSETHYGDAVNAEKAPEIINGIVSSLPPEQLYDLMKQMKECIHNNPVEARNMLLQNPQLGYALLQAQVIMKIVDPEVAKTMMHAQHKVPGPIPISTASTSTSTSTSKVMIPVPQPKTNDHWRTFDPSVAPPPRHPDTMNWQMNTSNHGHGLIPNLSQIPPPNHIPFFRPPPFHGRPELARSFLQRDFRPMMPDNRPPFGNVPYRDLNFMNLPPMSIPPPGIVNEPPPPIKTIQSQIQNPNSVHSSVSQSSASQSNTAQSSNKAIVSDTEKASLIMQVLQLTEAQIALLPPEQRQSILDLKEKISVSQRKLFLDKL